MLKNKSAIRKKARAIKKAKEIEYKSIFENMPVGEKFANDFNRALEESIEELRVKRNINKNN